MTRTESLIKNLIKEHGKHRNSLMTILQGVVAQEKYLSKEAMKQVAEHMDLSAAEVYGTASFYTFLDSVPRGRNIIRVCQTISCAMAGKNKIIEALEAKLKIKMGETTRDGNFSLLPANCMGWCHKGPAMLINDDVYTELTTKKIAGILKKYTAT